MNLSELRCADQRCFSLGVAAAVSLSCRLLQTASQQEQAANPIARDRASPLWRRTLGEVCRLAPLHRDGSPNQSYGTARFRFTWSAGCAAERAVGAIGPRLRYVRPPQPVAPELDLGELFRLLPHHEHVPIEACLELRRLIQARLSIWQLDSKEAGPLASALSGAGSTRRARCHSDLGSRLPAST